MQKSKYLEKFTRLQTEGEGSYLLLRDRVLIEVLPKEQLKTAGGLYVGEAEFQRTDTKDNRPTLAVVLMLGMDFYSSDTTEEASEDTVAAKGQISPGDIVLVSQVGLKYYSEFPGLVDYTKNTLALTTASEIHMIFPAPNGFDTVQRLLNA